MRLPLDPIFERVLKEELVDFYNIHDPSRLQNMDRMLEVANKKGRSRLNKKLNNIYGKDLDSIIDRSKLPVCETEVLNYIAHLKDGFQVDTSELIILSKTLSREEFNDLLARNFGDPLAKDSCAVYEEDLITFFLKHDPGRLEQVDELMRFASKIGYFSFNRRLRNLYGTDLDGHELNDSRDTVVLLSDEEVNSLHKDLVSYLRQFEKEAYGVAEKFLKIAKLYGRAEVSKRLEWQYGLSFDAFLNQQVMFSVKSIRSPTSVSRSFASKYKVSQSGLRKDGRAKTDRARMGQEPSGRRRVQPSFPDHVTQRISRKRHHADPRSLLPRSKSEGIQKAFCESIEV